MTITLGNFNLTLEPSGKLAQLEMDSLDPFLHETRHRMAIGPVHHFEPRGWDECFPTIEPFEDSPVMGDLACIPPRSTSAAQQFQQEWNTVRFTATRTFRAISPNELEMRFFVQSRMISPLKFLWASHAIFSTQNLARVIFPDGSVLDDFSLNNASEKIFKGNHGFVRLSRRDCQIQLQTDQAWWGIWNNRGGWPANQPAGFGCLGIEATNCDADLPKDATIAPGGQFEGCVMLRVYPSKVPEPFAWPAITQPITQ